MKPLLTLLLIGINFCCAAQTDTISVDENLQLAFPKLPDSVNRKGIRVFYVYTTEASYMASINGKRRFEIRDETHYKRILNASVKGFFSTSNTKHYKKEIRDSIVGGVTGKFIHAFAPKDSTGFREIFCFMTMQDDKVYVVQLSIRRQTIEDMTERIRNFFGSVKFNGRTFPLIPKPLPQ